MEMYLVTFRNVGDINIVFDSVWTISERAQRRVEELEAIKSGNIDGIDWEPIPFDEPGYTTEELEG